MHGVLGSCVYMYVCACVCVCVCMRVCVRACINQSVRIWEFKVDYTTSIIYKVH